MTIDDLILSIVINRKLCLLVYGNIAYKTSLNLLESVQHFGLFSNRYNLKMSI